MWAYLWSVLGLAALCALWVSFQIWLRRQDPSGGDLEERCRGCGTCDCASDSRQKESAAEDSP
jgi:hypothetical protein